MSLYNKWLKKQDKESTAQKTQAVQHQQNLKKIRIQDAGGSIPEPEKSNDSMFWKVFDAIDRPANAGRVAVQRAMQGRSIAGGLKDGLTGRDRVYWEQLLGDMGMQKGFGRSAAGFVLDGATDPLIWAGGPIRRGAQAAANTARKGTLLQRGAQAVAKDGILGAPVKAPFRALDDGLTRAGVNPELKFRFKDTPNLATRAVQAVGEKVPLISKSYVKTADSIGHNFIPDYVAKNYTATRALEDSVLTGTKRGGLGKRAVTPQRGATLNVGDRKMTVKRTDLGYQELRDKIKKRAVRPTLNASKAAENSAYVALKRVTKDMHGITPENQAKILRGIEATQHNLSKYASLIDDAVGGQPRLRQALLAEGVDPRDVQMIIDSVEALGKGKATNMLKAYANVGKGIITKTKKSYQRNLDIIQEGLGKHSQEVLDKAALAVQRQRGMLALREVAEKQGKIARQQMKQQDPELYKQMIKIQRRFAIMANKEGIKQADRVGGYVHRHTSGVKLDRGQARMASMKEGEAVKRLLNPDDSFMRPRKFFTTEEAIEASRKSFETATDTARTFLKRQGGSSAKRVQKNVAKYQALLKEGKIDDALEHLRTIGVDDMVEALNRGLDINVLTPTINGKVQPIFDIASDLGEAMIQREVQHANVVAGKRLMRELRTNGYAVPAIADAPKRKRALTKKLADLSKKPTLTPDETDLMRRLGKELTTVEQYLKYKQHFPNAMSTNILDGEKWLIHPQVMKAVDRMQGTFARSPEINELRSMYKQALGIFKQSVTGLRPAWYVTNLVGNVFNGYLGGLTDMTRYSIVAQLQSQTPAGKRAVAAYLAKHKVPSLKAAKRGVHQWMGADELYDILRKQGLEGFGSSHDALGTTVKTVRKQAERQVARQGMSRTGAALDVAKQIREAPLDGSLQASRQLADSMESNAKFALFLDDFIKNVNRRPNMSYGSLKAQTRRSRDHSLKYLFDYSDVTQFESVVKDFIPFYTYQRKNIPVQLEVLFKSPEIHAQFHRLREASLFADYTQEEIDAMPEWLREKAISIGRGRMLTPNLPQESLDMMTETNELAGMITPFLTKPLELVSNTNFFTGAPVSRFEGEKKNIGIGRLNMEVPAGVRHVIDTHGMVRGFNQSADSYLRDPDEQRATEAWRAPILTTAIGRNYNPEQQLLNQAYGRDRQLADVIRALRADKIDVRSATEILKGR